MAQESLSDLNAQNQSLIGAKRRAEAEMETVKHELDDASNEARDTYFLFSGINFLFTLICHACLCISHGASPRTGHNII